MAGRRPKPSAIREASGNAGHRRLNKHEPKPQSVATCPEWLADEAREEWNRLAPELEFLGLLSNLDASGLAMYCEAFQRWRRAVKHIAEHGPVDKTENGYAVQSPYVAIANSAAETMRKMLLEYGMSPASRSKVTVDKKKGSDRDGSWAQFAPKDPVDELYEQLNKLHPGNRKEHHTQ